MLTASTAYLSLFWTSREAHAGPNELSGNRFALLYILPPIAVSLVGNLAAATFIGYGLIGGCVHTCRRTFEFFDIWLSATLRSDSYGFAAKG